MSRIVHATLLTVSALAIAAWVWSYQYTPSAGVRFPNDLQVGIWAGEGRVVLGWGMRDDPPPRWGTWFRNFVRQQQIAPNTFWMSAGFYRHFGRSIGNIVVPSWLLVVVPALPPVVALWRKTRRRRTRLRLGLCLRCGYDLRGSNDRCPECGEDTNRDKTRNGTGPIL
jgi:hypothetical protein